MAKARANRFFQLFLVLAIAALAVRLPAGSESETPLPPIDLAALSVDRVAVGMTEADVLAVRGEPESRRGDWWNYEQGFVSFENDSEGLWRVGHVSGDKLYSGTKVVLEIGVSQERVRRAFSRLREPRVEEREAGCVAVPHSWEFIPGFDDEICYDEIGLGVSFLNGRVDSLSLSLARQ